jgi:hypothetical protein
MQSTRVRTLTHAHTHKPHLKLAHLRHVRSSLGAFEKITQARTHARMHARTHAQPRARAHTHTHTHPLKHKAAAGQGSDELSRGVQGRV